MEHIGPAFGQLVERHVLKQRNVMLAKQMEGVEMLGKSNVQILRELCEGWVIHDQLKRYNNNPIQNHIDTNEMVVTSAQFLNVVIHWGMSTLK